VEQDNGKGPEKVVDELTLVNTTAGILAMTDMTGLKLSKMKIWW
jgi:hypothetical protein